jgi:flagellar hook-associated protein 3 FlgL
MRVTSNGYSESLIAQLQTLSRRQVDLQSQISSGQRVTDASDDPLSAQQVFGLRDESVSLGQYQKNIETHQEFATATQSVIGGLQKIVSRAQEIAASVDGLDSKGDLQSYGTEVSGLIKQAVQLANQQERGEYILAGTKMGTPPFAATTDAQGNIMGVTYQGNSDQSSSEIAPGVLVSSQVPGANSSGSGEWGLLADSRSGSDFFAHLITLRDQLNNGDATGVQSSSQADLQKDEENVLYHVANNGALQAHLDTTLTANKNQKLSVESGISSRTDIDMAQAIVHLNQQQTSYQAALQSAGSVMSLSLLTFLK